MKLFGTIVTGLVVVALTTAEEKKPAFDAAKLVGDWSYVSGKEGGSDVKKEVLSGKVKFTKDTITVPSGGDKPFLMSYTVNDKTSPAEIDMTIKDGPVKEGKALGIISVDGDELKLAYTVVMDKNAKRPAKFESTKDNKAFFFVMKRAK